MIFFTRELPLFLGLSDKMKVGRYLIKKVLLLLLAVWGIGGNTLYADNELKLLTDSLHRMIDEKPVFIHQKEVRIERIKSRLKAADLTPEQEYKINIQLYDEYKKFVVDSAIRYIDRNVEIARQVNKAYLKYESALQLSLLYSMCGRYRDAEIVLEDIKSSELPRELLPIYYETYSRFWEYYSITTTNNKYGEQRTAYLDSLLALLDHNSFEYKQAMSYYYDRNDSIRAKKILRELLDTEEVGSPNYAMVTHSCASLYSYLNKPDEAKKYYMMSAITDIRNATRETASLQALALMLYEDRNLADAFKFTQSVIDDVLSSGIHFRAMEIYKFYSIVNSAYQAEQAKSKENLLTFLISTSIILFLLVLLVVCIYLQMRKILRIKRELSQSNEELLRLNEKLNAMNNQLNDTNGQLCEINSVKEQYIAEFFDVCFSYISKMEKFQNVLYKYAINKYYDELIKKLKSSTLIDEELSALYARFDKVFLGLYPTFVSDLNALLKEEERIVLKPDTLLNRELRIYALLRLGITDSGKIANFLRCSTSTVYNYRTKMRKRAVVDKDEFECEIMKISSTQEK